MIAGGEVVFHSAPINYPQGGEGVRVHGHVPIISGAGVKLHNQHTGAGGFTFSELSWSVEQAQALLDEGKSIYLESGEYDLGTIGLSFTQPNTDFIGFGDVKLHYHGVGSAMTSNPGSTGEIAGVHLRGDSQFVGVGIEINGGGMRVRRFWCVLFREGIFFNNGQITRISEGRIIACDVGIRHGTEHAQNLIDVDTMLFRACRRSLVIPKAKCVRYSFCDFENAKEMAVWVSSLTGGAIQALSFHLCWFEANNTSMQAEDMSAEVEVVSQGGLHVRGMRFVDCYWSFGNELNSDRKSIFKLRIGSNDLPHIQFEGGLPEAADLLLNTDIVNI
tara:strand:- start:4860 stop:5855 length:996 start_codon:yes stop_codon:yes gene_type:complete